MPFFLIIPQIPVHTYQYIQNESALYDARSAKASQTNHSICLAQKYDWSQNVLRSPPACFAKLTQPFALRPKSRYLF